MRTLIRIMLLGALLVLSGCSTSLYVLRSGYEEARILWRRQPMEQVLQQPDVDDETKGKLRLVLDVRAFARDVLGLNVGGSFTGVARVDADQVAHVVVAAHRDRLELVTHWFPIVGAVPYQGYFDEADARAAAAELEAEGFDTVVQPSVAFSTLGWFDDPLLTNQLRFDRVSLAGVIMHELTHNTRYLAGQGAFNESFATFVGFRGAAAFFAARGAPDHAARAEQLWHDSLAFSRFLGEFTAQLQAAYENGIDEAERQRRFQRAQTEFRRLDLQTNLNHDFARAPLNNARILHYLLYNDRLALFDAVAARNNGDLRTAIARVLETVDGAGDAYVAIERSLDVHPTPLVASAQLR